MKQNRFDAVIFDMNGTLLDTLKDIADSMKMAQGLLKYKGGDK